MLSAQNYFYFFFQAEDGIRDGRVTGVQTCALPIFFAGQGTRDRSGKASFQEFRIGNKGLPTTKFAQNGVSGSISSRSEERRVGKECRSRWSSNDYYKKMSKSNADIRLIRS